MRGRNVAPDAVVLYFKPAAEDRNVLVCLRDGAVQVLTREQFEQRVKD